MTPSHATSDVLIRYACPKCQYDVTRTLMDDITVCPECGAPISESICESKQRPMRPRTVVGLFAAMALGAWVLLTGFLLFFLRGGGIGLFGLRISRDVLGFLKLGAICAVCAIACYALWVSEERYRNRKNAAASALLKTSVVFGAEVVLMCALGWWMAHASSV